MKAVKWEWIQGGIVIVRDEIGNNVFAGIPLELAKHVVHLHNDWVNQRREDTEAPNETI